MGGRGEAREPAADDDGLLAGLVHVRRCRRGGDGEPEGGMAAGRGRRGDEEAGGVDAHGDESLGGFL